MSGEQMKEVRGERVQAGKTACQQAFRWEEAKCDFKELEESLNGWCVENKALHGLEEAGELSGQWSGCQV